ncbi:MAG: hypothetical protein WBM71_11235 [Sedimenticolaceae bacterium]
MPSRPTSRPADQAVRAQLARIVELESALWHGGLNESVLEPYQAAFRELEGMIAAQGADRRHHFVVVIPVADSPRQLEACLDSLLTLCRLYGYGGTHQGRFRKVSVLLADDSADQTAIARNREIAEKFDRAGIAIHYFGIDEQLALMRRLRGVDLGSIVGKHLPNAFGHKGQAMMRNIAYLKLAGMQAGMEGEPLLFYTVDGDQEFRVRVASADGGRSPYAVNFFHHLDRIFSDTDARMVTGKVVGDPPVSPAVMAGNLLEDTIGFVREMAGVDPRRSYAQPVTDTRGSGEAAYHDMADMFGFQAGGEVYRYRCNLAGDPSNAACFEDFARRLDSFFHGEHPTRVTWYRHRPVADSVEPARTVYTGNYVFGPDALGWFIPFAPLRLRMSGPTMGRLLKSGLGDRFVSANLPMLHRRTLTATGRSEFRPGVIAGRQAVDLCDEFERQFFGDIMLFSMERLTAMGFPDQRLPAQQVLVTLDAVHEEMHGKYRSRQRLVSEHLDVLGVLLRDAGHWWNHSPGLMEALRNFDAFISNMAHNFGEGSPCHARVDAPGSWDTWRSRQLDAITGLYADRRAWQQALDILRDTGP